MLTQLDNRSALAYVGKVQCAVHSVLLNSKFVHKFESNQGKNQAYATSLPEPKVAIDMDQP